jgi:hypothetical protein
MPTKIVEKEEWLEHMQENTILLGSFEPAANLITMEFDCHECGRPVYIGPHEKGDATVICILCGLKFFSEPDREIIKQVLIPESYHVE